MIIRTIGAPETLSFVDRSNWKEGPWDKEPEDQISWLDADTELRCLMKRNSSGSWCGYASVSKGHPFYGMNYNNYEDLHELHIVHGGLTYSGPDSDDSELWWFGFDTCHAFDESPNSISLYGPHTSSEDSYRNKEYVIRDILKLAKILKKAL
jgi:hypothetical protein